MQLDKWEEGPAIFAEAFARVLQRLPRARAAPTPRAATASPRRRAPRVRGSDAYAVIKTWHGARRGTKRHSQLEIVLAHTSVRAARLAGAEACDIALAVDWGLIKMEGTP